MRDVVVTIANLSYELKTWKKMFICYKQKFRCSVDIHASFVKRARKYEMLVHVSLIGL